MQQGRGGMGSRKHGRSGHATKSPRFRLWARLDAERRPERSRPQGYVSELDPRAPFPRQATLTPALNPGISAGLQIRIRGGVPNWRLGLTANQRGKLHALEDLLSYAIRPKRVATPGFGSRAAVERCGERVSLAPESRPTASSIDHHRSATNGP